MADETYYNILLHYEGGREERFGTTDAVWDSLFDDVKLDWLYIPFTSGGALVNTRGLRWVSVYPDPPLHPEETQND